MDTANETFAHDLRTALESVPPDSSAAVTLNTITRVAEVVEFDLSLQVSDYTPLIWHPTYPVLTTSFSGRIWSTHGDLIYTFPDQGGGGKWTANGRWCCTYSQQPPAHRRVHLHDLQHAQSMNVDVDAEARTYPHPTSSLVAICHPPLGLHLWDGRTGARIVAETHPTPVWAACWSPNGEWLMGIVRSSPHDAAPTLLCWHRSGVLQSVRQLPTPVAESCAWHPHSTLFVTKHGPTLCWWNPHGTLIEQVAIPSELDHPAYFTEQVVWSPNGQYLAVVMAVEVLIFTMTGEVIARCTSPIGEEILNVAWHPSSTILAIGSFESCLSFWSLDGQLLHTIMTWQKLSSFAAPYILSWSPDGAYLASCLRNYSVHLYGVL